jgi:hypothetical protein
MERLNAIRFRLFYLRVRRGSRAAAWLAARIPRSWRYWVILDSVAKFTTDHPKVHPGAIGAMDLAGFFEPELPKFTERRVSDLWGRR